MDLNIDYIEITENDEYHENEMRFSAGELYFFSAHRIYGGDVGQHTFTAESTRKLYDAMREYYESND